VNQDSAISVCGLTHHYGEKEVLHSLDFTVPWGLITGYLGPNGAGKSTTLKVLSGLLDPTSGVVEIAGYPPTSQTARQTLGYLPDDGGLYGLLSPREHLALVSDLYELDSKKALSRQEELVAMFGIEDLLDTRIDSLSKGQKQRVALCCSLLHEPKVLLLDEPLAGLDIFAVRKFRDELRRLANEGAAVLYCSHILDVVERLCDHTVILMEGRVVTAGATKELVSNSTEKTLESVFQQLSDSKDLLELRGPFDDEDNKGPQ